ncbi:epimerase [Roseobacter sp. HKCCD9010]|uniref:epimerase n=1 Tax=unclassified Roseobacter TaxID=196798 RepID=UPI0014914863|nr:MULTISPECIES: epimerase [unclassified Roseobacter]MBF9050959.1 epimerase [Rhodobacterales bacterium HKCCD4356]NNV12728.1 epimerase [Roseobacter sp. HKCCD7357]NNV16672.1 epimerase [Roseobacter sp. HKCCD8768]NNV26696.1 epimerase [Roseobacter sp. HKCCD8192]NNV30391.1 epimerase [Roseobacter sp. HKCCD9061]
MTQTALILGATGRFGRNASAAFREAGWDLRLYDRTKGDLLNAASGADVIVNGWNPPYSKWAALLPGLTRQVIEAAKASGATVMQPANVYVYGFRDAMPRVVGPEVPQRATNGLGRLRIEMEQSYRDADVQVILLRGGDFLDNQASAGWFDRIIAKDAATGKLSYPGALDQPHSWAFLPDMTAALPPLAEMRADLGQFTDLAFGGYTLTGEELATACGAAVGREVTVSRMSWLPLQIARPSWAEARYLLEMRYLWDQPHELDGTALATLLPDLPQTPVEDAIRAALEL